jgi:hypothetical protein
MPGPTADVSKTFGQAEADSMEKCFRVLILKIVISPALGRERQDEGVHKR